MLLFHSAQVISADQVGHRATGPEVGQQNFFIRSQNPGRFSHEMDTAENNEVGLDLGCFPAEFQGITNKSAMSWTSSG